MLLPFLYGGEADRPLVKRARAQGLDLGDGLARDVVIEEIWSAVDRGGLRPVVIGGPRRRVIRLDPALTLSVPGLRSPRGRGFTYLRPSNPAYRQLTSWFGIDLANVVVAFRQTEIRKLGNTLKRRRRRRLNSVDGKKRAGRPSLSTKVGPVIQDVITRKKWSPPQSMKTLTREVNRLGNWATPVSEETVTRNLNALHAATGDRRFLRTPRKPRRS
jgi:hypothetical protein